ncbi:MAG TPA: response regulator [Rhizomicrobium sp.]|jgi:CheY-like chemotaxis protein
MSHASPQVATILLVEDEPLIRMATAAILEDEGYRVLEGRDADEALAILRANPEISIVVTDVQMPGKIDGLDLVRIIGQEYPRIQTLITSGRASLGDARQCGADKYLPKPYSASAIQSAVFAICSGA